MAKEIGVTQKTAWFMLGRLREALARLDFFIRSVDGKRLTYARLTA
jgi:hypothetical protein